MLTVWDEKYMKVVASWGGKDSAFAHYLAASKVTKS
jgi:diphthamide synthase (EF-2-diphthine--ammonia ligase)